jgi:predicted amidohydrolase
MVCWADERLPQMAALSPFSGSDLELDPEGLSDEAFFGIRPRINGETVGDGPTDSVARVVAALSAAHEERATVAVVPEFSLRRSDELPDGLAADSWSAFPPLIVAGSAHEIISDRRLNRSVTYLDGVAILEYSKHFPFVLKWTEDGQGESQVQRELREGISDQPRLIRLACGSATRLAVAICSDLNSSKLVSVLNLAAVNLLLCPSWTPKDGAFSAVLTGLAGQSQCVSLVANTPGHLFEPPGDDLLIAVTAVPRAETSATIHTSEAPMPLGGIVDPNRAPDDDAYWRWIHPR